MRGLLRNFLINRNGGGSTYGGTIWQVWGGLTQNQYSGVNNGDLLFFDWQSNGSLDHVTMQVARGTDTLHGLYGDLADQHSGGEYHEFWSKWSWNGNAATTVIYAMHIWPGN